MLSRTGEGADARYLVPPLSGAAELRTTPARHDGALSALWPAADDTCSGKFARGAHGDFGRCNFHAFANHATASQKGPRKPRDYRAIPYVHYRGNDLRGLLTDHAATATAKSARLRELQNGVVATQRKIQYAEQLIQQQEAIAADHEAIQQIAQLAQQLHETELAYRFYTVVDGHEVDVLVAQ